MVAIHRTRYIDSFTGILRNGFRVGDCDVKVENTPSLDVLSELARLAKLNGLDNPEALVCSGTRVPSQYYRIKNLIDLVESNYSKDLYSKFETDIKIIHKTIGTWSYSIPMVCFTDFSNGTVCEETGFGSFGICMKPHWLKTNGARKVRYVEKGDPESIQLTNELSFWQMVMDREALGKVIDTHKFIEVAIHGGEDEIRIAGVPDGFPNYENSIKDGDFLKFEIGDIHSIYAPSDYHEQIRNVLKEQWPRQYQELDILNVEDIFLYS